jgi:putative N-acetylmannosamine-6-phosphate epimerase
MAMEEKVITLERSDSEKSRTPFIGFLKEEEEEAQIVVTPQKQEVTRELCNLSSKEAASTPRRTC